MQTSSGYQFGYECDTIEYVCFVMSIILDDTEHDLDLLYFISFFLINPKLLNFVMFIFDLEILSSDDCCFLVLYHH